MAIASQPIRASTSGTRRDVFPPMAGLPQFTVTVQEHTDLELCIRRGPNAPPVAGWGKPRNRSDKETARSSLGGTAPAGQPILSQNREDVLVHELAVAKHRLTQTALMNEAGLLVAPDCPEVVRENA